MAGETTRKPSSLTGPSVSIHFNTEGQWLASQSLWPKDSQVDGRVLFCFVFAYTMKILGELCDIWGGDQELLPALYKSRETSTSLPHVASSAHCLMQKDITGQASSRHEAFLPY